VDIEEALHELGDEYKAFLRLQGADDATIQASARERSAPLADTDERSAR
jgi:hypothetical protein